MATFTEVKISRYGHLYNGIESAWLQALAWNYTNEYGDAESRWRHLVCFTNYLKCSSYFKILGGLLKVDFKELKLSTRERLELVDITELVTSFVRECEVESGICLVHSSHSTTAIVVNEREAGLVKDILSKIRQEFPRGGGWLHDRVDDNADAHLASVFLGHSQTFPIRNGRINRGTWQNIFLLEMDGPRTRRVTCEVIGE